MPRAIIGKQRKKTAKFNHSSFCGGDSVICAGVLAVDKKGFLLYIHSASGHYKASRDDLIRALAVLSSAGIYLKRVRAKGFATGQNYVAASLVTGPRVMWDPAQNATLGLSAEIGA